MRPTIHRAPPLAVLAGLIALTSCDEFTQESSRSPDNLESRTGAYLRPPAGAAPRWLRTNPEMRITRRPTAGRGTGKPSPLTNGSFELNGGVATNEFTGWTEVDLPNSSGSWLVQTGETSPLNGAQVEQPTDGGFAAMTDQFGPGTHILYQDVLVPAHGPVVLGFDLSYQNFAGDFVTPPTLSFEEFPNQQFRVDVMDPSAPLDDVGSGVLLRVFRTEVGDEPFTGYRTITASLQRFAGRVVRIRFAEVDDLSNFLVGIDRVTVARHVHPLREHKLKGRATAVSVPFAPEPGPFAHVLTLDDDQTTGPLPIGFSFTFFGQRYTEFNLSSNGFIGFEPGMSTGCCNGGVIPSDDGLNDIIAAAWVDLLPPAGGQIAWETRGTKPNRRLVVSWRDVPVFGEDARVSTQIILYERKNAIEIHTRRQDLSESHVYTQGVENLAGTVAGFIPGRVSANYALRQDGVRFTTSNARAAGPPPLP
jgi:hypothetical protein